ncbi:hypothetical protein Ddye_010263 [Dipteronia dyeriana]|uniref:MIP18 family-like domain-containing protein n=1 Tax=Dipteronia dyeriana TaxID=168575 RepID=A0AAD9XCY4_9ROSI|nr:hypothetical protein Ddye_010263 [Dipteronia dyeriana]
MYVVSIRSKTMVLDTAVEDLTEEILDQPRYGFLLGWWVSPDPIPCTKPACIPELVNYVRDIRDPEHPYSLEQLSVLSEESVTVDEKLGRILITFTPTIQHCSMATVIGLCLRVKLKEFFPPHFKLDIRVAPGSHANEESVNKQLNDKERVAAALENPNLRQLVDECLYSNEL